MEIPEIDKLGPWAGMVLLGVLLVYLLKQIVPSMLEGMKSLHKSFEESLTEQRKEFRATLKEDRQEQMGCLTAMKDAVNELARRCPGGKGA